MIRGVVALREPLSIGLALGISAERAAPEEEEADDGRGRVVGEAGHQATRKRCKARAEIDQVVEAVASNVGVPAELLHAVIRAESNYEQTAISPKGAIGLMQVMPATATRFGVADLHDIRSNVLAGATYLKWLIAYFDGRLELALAGYNAGEQAVVRAGRQIPAYPETRAYVRRVLKSLPAGFAATTS